MVIKHMGSNTRWTYSISKVTMTPPTTYLPTSQILIWTQGDSIEKLKIAKSQKDHLWEFL